MKNKIFICLFIAIPYFSLAASLEPSDIEILRNEFDALSSKKSSNTTTYKLPENSSSEESRPMNSLETLPAAKESFVDLDDIFSDEPNSATPKRKR